MKSNEQEQNYAAVEMLRNCDALLDGQPLISDPIKSEDARATLKAIRRLIIDLLGGMK